MTKLRAWLRERIGARGTGTVAGGPSFAYVLGWTLVIFLVVEAVTGAALAAFYSPSTTGAWASVAYIDSDQVALGWLVRGLHFHAGSALAIVAGAHLVQTAVFGAYKRPRELVWWLGLVALVLVLAFALSGFVLRWDQEGYNANRVEVQIAAATPVLGKAIRELAIGGNEYGNLTLTRFYALHVAVLPALLALVVIAHVVLARRHGATPHWSVKADAPAVPRWPAQTIRDVTAMALAFAALLAFTIHAHGAPLAAPADPSSPYDARPLWYFRWLFELRELAGSYEKLAALAAPAIVGGFFVALPIFDRGDDRSPQRRGAFVLATLVMLATIAALTGMSFNADAGDDALAKRQDKADARAHRARDLATRYGVPVSGGQDVFAQPPMWRARSLYEKRCKSCHDDKSKDRKGPIIAPGHHDRAWVKKFLLDPSGPAFWGKTKFGATQDAMKQVTLEAPDNIDDIVELVYAESGASDVDAKKVEAGKKVFEKYCDSCHSHDEGVASASAINLGALATREWFARFVANPKSAQNMTAANSEMPRFDRELSPSDRDEIAGYLVWLRTHTQQDLDRLDPLTID